MVGVGLVNSGASDLYGGGLYVAGSEVSLEDCVIWNNVAEYGGGIYASWYSTLSLEGLTIFENSATVSGGGIFLYVMDSDISLSDSVFESNTAETGNGGAIASEWYNHLSVVNSVFRDNTSNTNGGALYSAYYQDLLVEDSVFERNTAGWGEGGAIYHYPADENGYPLQISDSEFRDNSAYGSGGAVVAYWLSDLEISGSTFQGNAAGPNSAGGAVLVYVTHYLWLSHNNFCLNEAGSGGAVSSQWVYTWGDWHRNVFVENTGAYGGAAHRYASYSTETVNNTFAGNRATVFGGAYYASWAYTDFRNNAITYSPSGHGIYAADAYSQANTPVAYNDFYDNQAIHGAGYFHVNAGSDGNIDEAPGFVDYTLDGNCGNDDLRLRADSALIDAGDPEREDEDGSPSDIGALEALSDTASEEPADTGAPEETGGETGETSEKEDCGCTSGGRAPGLLWVLALGIGLRRRASAG
jgi:predicted outer membrane repeat protein